MDAGTTAFYYIEKMRGVERAIVRVVYGQWTRYMLEMAGIYGEPFYTRASFTHESPVMENGHPFAWLYRDVEKCFQHEAHYVSPEAIDNMKHQLKALLESLADERRAQSGLL